MTRKQTKAQMLNDIYGTISKWYGIETLPGSAVRALPVSRVKEVHNVWALWQGVVGRDRTMVETIEAHLNVQIEANRR